MKKLIIILMTTMLTFSLLLIACDRDDDPDPEKEEVEVNANFDIYPDNPVIGQEVYLDASSSTVKNAENLEYSWSLTTPEESEAELLSENTKTTAFTADKVGEHTVELVLTANGKSDQTTKSFEVNTPEVLSYDITTDITLPSDITYLVTGEIQVTAELTIEAGTTIEFENGTGFELSSSDGSIIAKGTEDEPILLTGTDKQPGWWNGIFIRESSNIKNEFSHVIIEYGGGKDFRRSGSGNLVIGQQLSDDSRLTLNNSISRHSGSDGLWVRLNGNLHGFEDNSFTDNNGAPVTIASNKVHQLDGASDYSGNEKNYVHVMSGHDIEDQNVTWNILNVPYRIQSGIINVSKGELHIDPGTELQFEQGGRIQVIDHGALIAKGTQNDPILFTATDQQPGWWDGIFIRESGNMKNELDYVTIEYAGGEDYRRSEPGNVVVGRRYYDDSRLTMTNSSIRHSSTNGLWVRSNGIVNEDICDVNTFENNAGTDCHIED